MRIHRIVIPTALCLIAAAALASEPECAVNYKSDATSATTSVLTTLAPREVIEMLPRKLAAAGASMDWATPAKGILKAGSLDVRADASGSVTRVVFHTSPASDKDTLCRYAMLVGNPPLPAAPPVPQDAALIAQMKDDLLKKHQIVQPGISRGLNNATFRSLDDFLQFTLTGIKNLSDVKREYNVSLQVPRETCSIASEDLDDSAVAMLGQAESHRTKPARADATLIYEKNGAAWKLTDAFLTHIETMK
ncbi:MAG: hypothetical protein JO093_04375 [Acidobacteria bacterium]|nr:hypothetical protein [Acidobacteriota bacterium]MBV9070867.1 hypothetical protein [Acidobacteriota bacterium]MBV9184827.1 hypothetical protein [Acidobacteriota bacterium]